MQNSIKEQPVILVVDDDQGFLEFVREILQYEGYKVLTCSDGEEALKVLSEQSIDVMLLDIKMPKMDGLALLKEIREKGYPVDVLMITAYHELSLAVESLKLGAKEFLTKPINPADLIHRVKTTLRTRVAERQLKEFQTEFTARLLYNLRHPMTEIKSGLSFLTKGMAGPLTEAQQEVISHLSSNIEKGLALLTDMLDLTNFEAGRVQLEIIPTNLDEALPSILGRLGARARAKNLTLKTIINSNIPTIPLDIEKIEQVVVNLVENAIQYTDEGGTITVTLSPIQTNVDGKITEWIELVVQDTGIGINQDELPFIFDKYREFLVKKTSKRKTTGLGLTICRKIVEAHGGKITAESEVGKGTTIRVLLPIAV